MASLKQKLQLLSQRRQEQNLEAGDTTKPDSTKASSGATHKGSRIRQATTKAPSSSDPSVTNDSLLLAQEKASSTPLRKRATTTGKRSRRTTTSPSPLPVSAKDGARWVWCKNCEHFAFSPHTHVFKVRGRKPKSDSVEDELLEGTEDVL